MSWRYCGPMLAILYICFGDCVSTCGNVSVICRHVLDMVSGYVSGMSCACIGYVPGMSCTNYWHVLGMFCFEHGSAMFQACINDIANLRFKVGLPVRTKPKGAKGQGNMGQGAWAKGPRVRRSTGAA